MVTVPLLWILVASVHADHDNRLTLANFIEVFSQSIYLHPIWNSLVLATLVAVVACAIGTLVALAISRTDMPGRPLIRALVFAAFVTPSFLGATAWIFLAAPNSGWLNRGWVALAGTAHGPFNIYSLGGAIFVIALYSYPYVFAFVSSALELVPSEMESTAALLGANWFHTLIPARQQVITTQLYLFFQFPTHPNLAAAYAIPLLLVTASLFYVQQRLLRRGRFTTVGGKGGIRRPFRLGRWRWPVAVLCGIPPLLSLILPYGALLATSLSRAWGRGPVPPNLTFDWYKWAFANLGARHAIQHSLIYGAAAAAIATALALFVAYAVSRRLVPGAQLLGFVATAPFVIPGIVLAIGFFAAYARPPLVLYGTAWMLIVAFATRFLPIAYAGIQAALRTIDLELENAARTLGATPLRTFASITLPLLRRTVLVNWLLVFIPSLRELSCAVFLFTPATAVMSTLIFDLSDAGNFEPVSTLGILMMVLTLGLVAIAYRAFGGSPLVPHQRT